MEYSRKLILDKMNAFFGYIVVEKIKLITFEEEQVKFKEKINKKDVTKRKYTEKNYKYKK